MAFKRQEPNQRIYYFRNGREVSSETADSMSRKPKRDHGLLKTGLLFFALAVPVGVSLYSVSNAISDAEVRMLTEQARYNGKSNFGGYISSSR